jgi:hypothetical protein
VDQVEGWRQQWVNERAWPDDDEYVLARAYQAGMEAAARICDALRGRAVAAEECAAAIRAEIPLVATDVSLRAGMEGDGRREGQ